MEPTIEVLFAFYLFIYLFYILLIVIFSEL